jgi:hypothetical protein
MVPKDNGQTYQPGMADGLQRMVANAISSYGGMASMMMEMLNCMYGSGGQSGYGPGYCEEWNSPYGYPAPCELATYLCSTISIDIKSNKPCEVWLEFLPGTNFADLNPDMTLIACSDNTTKLEKVANFVAPTSTTQLLLHIDLTGVSAPQGLYQAAVFDTKGILRGTLNLCL